MKSRIKKILIFVVVFLSVISVGWFIYSSTKSNNEAPRRAILVINSDATTIKG